MGKIDGLSRASPMRDLANDEMVFGYIDGGDLSIPEPGENRSHSYRHSFAIRRAEITRAYLEAVPLEQRRTLVADELRRQADEAEERNLRGIWAEPDNMFRVRILVEGPPPNEEAAALLWTVSGDALDAIAREVGLTRRGKNPVTP